MAAQFALKLSREGIGLYRCEGGAWAPVGQAALDDPDLGGALAALRAQAASGGDGVIDTHLILPNSEIRYTEVTLEGVAGNEEAAAIRTAIEGLTPYAVGELEIDWVRAGDTARVAVIARETLREAAQFARAQGFSPVSFGAVPPPGAFPRDVDFGAAADAAADIAGLAEPESVVAEPVVAGPAGEEPAAAVAADSMPEASRVAGNAAAGDQEPPETLADWELDAPVAEPEAGFVEDGVAAPDRPDVVALDAGNETPADVAPSGEAAPEDEEPARAPGHEQPDKAWPIFASRRARVQAAPEAEAGAPRGDPAAPSSGDEVPEEAPIPAPDAQSPDGVEGAGQGVEEDTKAPEGGEDEDAGPSPEAAPDAGEAVPASAPAPSGGRGGKTGRKRNARSRRKTGGSKARGAGKAGAGAATARPSEPAPERAPTVITTPAPAPPATEAEALTVFGARRSGQALASGGVGRLPGRPIAAALAVLLLAGLGIAAFWLSPSRLPDLAGLRPDWPGGGSQQVAGPAAGPGEIAEQAGEVMPPDTAPAADPETGGRTPDDVAALAPGGTAEGAVAPSDEPAGSIDLAPAAGEAGADVAAAAPQSPDAPRESAVGGLFLASIDPEVTRPPAPWRPAPEQMKSDRRPARPMPPPPPGQRFELDARGLVAPSAGGTLSPEGVRVVAGVPAVTGPPRPAAVTLATRGASGALTVAPVPPPRPAAPPPAPGATADQGTAAPVEPEAEVLAAVPDVLLSVTPAARPADVPDAVRASLEAAEQQRVAAPIPTSASVATRATVNDGLELGRLSLIGVFGAEGNRRALVRLDSGEFVEVAVGDRLDGGRVVAIGQDALRYVRSGRNVQLKLPEEG